MKPALKSILKAIFVVVGYFCLARLGLTLPRTMGVSPIWVSAGFAIFVVWRLGFVYGLPLCFASVLVRYSVGTPLGVGVVVAIANVAAWSVAAKAMHITRNSDERFGSFTLPITIAVGALAGSTASALFGPIAMCLVGTVGISDFVPAVYTWWSRNLAGALSTLPFIFLIEQTWNRQQSRLEKLIEILRSLAFALCFGLLFFYSLYSGHSIVFIIFLLPFMVSVGNFLTELTTYLTLLTLLGIAIVMTCLDSGPFQWGTVSENLSNLNMFFSAVSACCIFIAAFKLMPARRRSFAVMLSSSIVASVVIWSLIEGQRRFDEGRVNRLTEVQIEEIQSRMQEHRNLLKASASFWKTLTLEGKPITPTTWQRFSEGLATAQNSKYNRTVGLIERVPRAQVQSYLKRQRKHIPEFQIRPYGEAEPSASSDDLYVVTTPPSHRRDSRALGRDLSTEPKRRAAIEYSAKHHQEKMSDSFPLLSSPAGFGIFYPLYDGERSVGWVHSMMTFEEFFSGISQPGKDEIGWSIAYENDPSNIVFRTQPDKILNRYPAIGESRFELLNTPILVRWHRLPGFANSLGPSVVWIFAFIAILAISLTATTTNLEVVKSRAELMAEKISHDLEKHRVAIFHSSKMSSLGHMAAGIAHEINNPLTIIMGLTHMILMDFERTRSPLDLEFGMSQIARLEKINKTVERISSIIRGLQSFSRSGQSLPFRATPLRQVVATVLDLCGQKFHHNQVDLRVADVPEIDIYVVAVQVEQVLMNLLTNSFDAVQMLDEKWVEIDFKVTDSRLMIFITDSGRGLPKEVATRIMEPFFTTKPVGKGTGLGLSICRGILETHQGQLIYIDGHANTRFRIELPLKPVLQADNTPVRPSFSSRLQQKRDIESKNPPHLA